LKTLYKQISIMKMALCCLCCLFLASCGRTYCPAFPEHLIDYLPYKTGDTLSFVNQYNDTLSFYVDGTGMLKEYSEPKCGKCKCGPPYFSVSLEGGWLEFVIGYASSIFINISLDECYFTNQVTCYLTTGNLETYFEYIKDWQNPKNGPLFGDTITVESSHSPITQAVIVWKKGITEFYDQKYNFQWKSIKK